MWPFSKRREPVPDNSDKVCHAVDQRLTDGPTLVSTCSLCGAQIELWPCRQDRCDRRLAKVEHV